MGDTKICNKCGRELPISEFSKNKSKKDGLQSHCKECGKHYYKQWYTENKEALAERKKQYYTENKEARKQYSKQYYTEHADERKQYKKQWYTKNKEAISEYRKQWYTENKERIKQYYQENKEAMAEYQKQWRTENKEYQNQWHATLKGYCNNIRNANIQKDRKYGRIDDELPSNYPTIEDYMELLQMPDFYDGKQYHFTEMGLDRIDNSLPHTLDNIVPCTTQHNRERHLMSFDEFKTKFLTKI